MTREETISKYKQEHNRLSESYYSNKHKKSKRVRLYLTPQTLVETSKRRVLRQESAKEQDSVKRELETGVHQERYIVREHDGNFNFANHPFKRFKDLTPVQRETIWGMVLDEDEFNYEHQNIWMRCNEELQANGYEPI